MVTFDYNPKARRASISCDESLLKLIRLRFSKKNDGAVYARRLGKKVVDRFYTITPNGTFDFGLHTEIEKYLVEQNITEVSYTDDFVNRRDCGSKMVDVWDQLKFSMRYYQSDTVKECIEKGCGIALLATSAGKSLTQANLIENFMRTHEMDGKFKCLLIVPGISLVDQMQNDFKEYGVSFTYSGWSGNSPLQDTQVVITNLENLGAKFYENPWIIDVDLLVGDECHRYKPSSSSKKKTPSKYIVPHKIIQMVKTPHKFGFTGTLSDDPWDQWKSVSLFGPVIYEKKSKELRDEKYISQVVAKVIKLIHPKTKKMTYREEIDYRNNSEARNNLIRKLANKLPNNTLILVNELEHGRNLLECISQLEDKQVFFVEGIKSVEERAEIIDSMEKYSNVICVAMSSIFSTGINIKNIHNIILAAGGKSFIRIVQGIGRGLRLHKDKSRLNLIDLCDNLKYSTNHVEERKTIYDTEQILWSEKEIIL